MSLLNAGFSLVRGRASLTYCLMREARAWSGRD
jgi:hypothetical protein